MSDDDRPVAGRYRLIARLGSGGMGEVWQAYDERLHRTVAIKKLLMPAALTGPQAEEAKRHAVREGRIAAKLQHPHLIMVYDVAEDDGQPYLVMEYLPSKSLSVVLAERGSLSPREVAEIGAQAAAALASAHAAGVVHRDVKPGNVLLGHDGTVKITDFGISRAVEDVTGTLTGVIAGTPAYLSPEVAKGQRASFASDVFSLGATLYTAVEGVPPFGTSDNAMAMLYRIVSEDPAPPGNAGPMTDLLVRLLRKDPELRPTMAEVSEALSAMADRRPAGATAAGAAAAALPTAQLTDGANGARPHTLEMPSVPAAPAGRAGAGAAGAGAAGVAGAGVAGAGAAAAAAGRAAPGYREAERAAHQGGPPVELPGRPTAWPAPRPEPARPQRGRRTRAAVLAAAVAVLAIAAVLLLTRLGDKTPGSGTASPPVTSAAAPGTTTAQQAQPATTSAPGPTSTAGQAPQPQPQPQPTQRPVPPQNTAGTPQDAIVDYYALMPGNLQEGWVRLTPKYQQSPAGGFDGYQYWWNQISSVRASGATATGANTVQVTIEYTFKDGRVVRERHSYTLVQQNGRWLIDESTVLSSQTL